MRENFRLPIKELNFESSISDIRSRWPKTTVNKKKKSRFCLFVVKILIWRKKRKKIRFEERWFWGEEKELWLRFPVGLLKMSGLASELPSTWNVYNNLRWFLLFKLFSHVVSRGHFRLFLSLLRPSRSSHGSPPYISENIWN